MAVSRSLGVVAVWPVTVVVRLVRVMVVGVPVVGRDWHGATHTYNLSRSEKTATSATECT